MLKAILGKYIKYPNKILEGLLFKSKFITPLEQKAVLNFSKHCDDT